MLRSRRSSTADSSSTLEVRLIGPHRRLLIGGYIYFNAGSSTSKKTLWKCPRSIITNSGKQQCSAEASTSNITETDGKITVYIGPNESHHNHLPDPISKFDTENGGGLTKIRGIPRSTQTDKHAAHYQGLNFMADVEKYRTFLSKFAENHSFERQSVLKILDGIWDLGCLGISRDGLCSVIQCNKAKIMSDLEFLESSNTSLSADPSSPSPTNSSNNLVDTAPSCVVPNSANPFSVQASSTHCSVAHSCCTSSRSNSETQVMRCLSTLEAQLLGSRRLMIGGYVYHRRGTNSSRTHWVCPRHNKKIFKKHRCRATASTSNIFEIDGRINVHIGPNESPHNHPPDPKDIEEAKIDGQRHRQLRESTMSDNSADIGEKAVLQFCSIPTKEKTKGRKRKITAYCKAMNFIKNPVEYQKFLLKFAKNPSFDRKSICEALDGIWDFDCLNISNLDICSVIRSHKTRVLADLDTLSEGIDTSTNSLHLPETLINVPGSNEVSNLDRSSTDPPKPQESAFDLEELETLCNENSVMAHPEANPDTSLKATSTSSSIPSLQMSITPSASESNEIQSSTPRAATVLDLEKIENLCQSAIPRLALLRGKTSTTETGPPLEVANAGSNDISQGQTQINGNSAGNEKIIELLTTTLEATFKTMQHFTEAMAKKDKKKRKRKKKDRDERRKEKRRKHDADVTNATSSPNLNPDNTQNASLRNFQPMIEHANSSTVVKEEYLAPDLVHEDVEISQINDDQFNVSNQRNYSQEHHYSNASANTFPEDEIASNAFPPVGSVTSEEFSADDPCNIASPLTRDFFSQSSTLQQIKPEYQPTYDRV